MDSKNFLGFSSSHKQIFHIKNFWEISSHLPCYFKSWTPSQEINPSLFSKNFLINPEKIHIGRGVTIEPFATLQGPLFIGDHVTIRSGAYLRPYTILEDHAFVGHGVEVKQSWIGPHASLSHHNYVGNSLIGAFVNVGASTIFSNVRLDKQEVVLSYQEEKIFTGQKKWGAVVGHHSQLGAGIVFNPGTIIEPESLIYNQQKICHLDKKGKRCF